MAFYKNSFSKPAMKECPECGKWFPVLYPHLWTYKKLYGGGNYRYWCTWKCFRAMERKGEEKRVGHKRIFTKEQESEAVRIALDGGNPLPYLEECGGSAPAQKWYEIKAKLKDTDPDTYAKLPDKLPRKDSKSVETPEGEFTAAGAMAGAKAAADEFFGKCKDMGLKIEVPETPADVPKIRKPVNYDGMTVREVEGVFGRYRRSDVNEKTYIDFEPVESLDVMSYTIEQWRSFRKEMEHAAQILGVEL
jgi:hypothetical protein